jgi:hypothetical protein
MHPGYNTYNNLKLMKHTVDFFKLIIKTDQIISRQHYLRWSQYDTVEILNILGVKEDYSLGYSKNYGFRCGTSKKFNLYDFKNRKKSSVIEYPLIVMDTTIFNNRIHNNTITDILRIKEFCKYYSGNFIILLHNHNYDNVFNRNLISKILTK